MLFMALRMNAFGGTFCSAAFTVVSTTTGSLRLPSARRDSAVMRLATISAFGPERSYGTVSHAGNDTTRTVGAKSFS